MSDKKADKRQRVKKMRSKLLGTAQRPRLSVYRSNKRIYIQAIDDSHNTTIAADSDSDLGQNLTKTAKAKAVGKKLGEKLKKLGIKSACFDRGQFIYHGRVKAVAEGVREAGIKF